MRKTVVVGVMVALLLAGGAPPAQAASVVREDPGTQQSAANDLVRARLTYAPQRVVYRLKIANLSRRHTRAIVRFFRPGYDLMIITKFVNGRRSVVARRTDYSTLQTRRFSRGVSVRWDFRRDVITISNTRFLRGDSALLTAYTVAKGQLHGPLTHPDDFVGARLRRG